MEIRLLARLQVEESLVAMYHYRIPFHCWHLEALSGLFGPSLPSCFEICLAIPGDTSLMSAVKIRIFLGGVLGA